MTQGYVHPTNKTETRPLKWDEGRRDMTSLMACADIPLCRSSRGKVIFYFEQFDSLFFNEMRTVFFCGTAWNSVRVAVDCVVCYYKEHTSQSVRNVRATWGWGLPDDSLFKHVCMWMGSPRGLRGGAPCAWVSFYSPLFPCPLHQWVLKLLPALEICGSSK